MEKTPNGTKGRIVRNDEWKKRRMEKTPNGTKCKMEKQPDGTKRRMKKIIFVVEKTIGHYMYGRIISKMVKNVENVRKYI